MDRGVEILFLAILCVGIVLGYFQFGHIYLRYNATSGDIVDNTVEHLDLETISIAVGILSVRVLELQITLQDTHARTTRLLKSFSTCWNRRHNKKQLLREFFCEVCDLLFSLYVQLF